MPIRCGKKETVVIAMSGGVDSSLAAVLLKEQGYGVIGVTMHLWSYESYGGNNQHDSACCSVEAVNDARALCESKNIPHYVLDLRKEFEQKVVGNFVSEYLSGRTPNPCVICNQKMKWQVLFEKAIQLGATRLATGHYAQIEPSPENGRYLLKRGIDNAKDQSYFLWILTQDDLRYTLFPLGSLTKNQTRVLARKHNLMVADKGDSQEICFIPDNNYRRFIEHSMEKIQLNTNSKSKTPVVSQIRTGPIKDQSGKTVGKHTGYPFYTIGQRKGLGIAAKKPLYVTEIDPNANTVYVGSEEDLYKHSLTATALNWISRPSPHEPVRCAAKIRYRHVPAEATLTPIGDGRISLRFDDPQRAITPGQSVVLYDGEVVIGGGIIENTSNAA